MEAGLERLVYVSTATGTTGSLANIAPILGQAQRNNARDGLTGALAAHNDRYIQVIEGPDHATEGLMQRLAVDPRHRDIRVLSRETIITRLFSDWTMAHAKVTPAVAGALDTLMAATKPEAAQIIDLLRKASLAIGRTGR